MHDRFEEWYAREHPRVLASVASRAGDLRLAEEVTAEAFARALERWDRVGAMESPGGWVHRVAANLYKRCKRRQRVERTLLRRQPPEPVVPPMVDAELWEAVRALPTRMREAVALRYIADLTERQVAERMDIAPGTVAATLHKARSRLAEHLDVASETEGHDA